MVLIIWVIHNEANFKKEINFVTYDEYYGGLKNYLLVRHISLSIYRKMTWYMWFSLKYLNLNKSRYRHNENCWSQVVNCMCS